MPFLAEELYQNLGRAAVRDAPASVHHSDFPQEEPARLDDELERRMRAAMRVVALGRAARSSAGVKTRMPLPKLIVVFDANDRDRGALESAGELAHHLNNLRKEAGLDIADRIVLRYDGPIADALAGYREFVAEESLATSVTRGLAGRGHAWKGELNGVRAELEIEKV